MYIIHKNSKQYLASLSTLKISYHVSLILFVTLIILYHLTLLALSGANILSHLSTSHCTLYSISSPIVFHCG